MALRFISLVLAVLLSTNLAGCAAMVPGQIGAHIGKAVWGMEYLVVGISPNGLEGIRAATIRKDDEVTSYNENKVEGYIQRFLAGKLAYAATIQEHKIHVLFSAKVGSFALPHQSAAKSFAEDAGMVIEFAGKPDEYNIKK